MLEAACEWIGGIVEVDEEFAKDGNMEEAERAIDALFRKAMFHNTPCANRDGITDEF